MKKKRFRAPRPSPGQIKIGWAKEGGSYSLVYAWGDGLRKGHVIPLIDAFERISPLSHFHHGKTLLQTLEEDGFDITTIRFSISRKVGDESQ